MILYFYCIKSRYKAESANNLIKGSIMAKYSLGDRIRSEMIRQGMSQRELAEKSGIAQPLISYMLNGSRKYGTYNPSLKSVVAVAGALGVSLDWLASGQEFGNKKTAR